VWLLPCAIASVLWPHNVAWILPLALGPLILAALAIGAGRAEPEPVAETKASPAVVIPFRPAAIHPRRTAVVEQEYQARTEPHRYPSVAAAVDRTANDAG
jgi:hypothetical protein